MGSGHIHVQLHEDTAFNFTLAILRQKKTHPVSLSCKSEADSPLLPCGFVAAVFLGMAVS